MKYLKQFTIIIFVTFLGELLSWLIPFPIPGSIYGILLMLIGLLTKIIPYDSVKETGHFLVEIMPIMFISPAVGLLDSWGIISDAWIPFVLITLVSTVVVMAVGGRVTQFVRRRMNKNA